MSGKHDHFSGPPTGEIIRNLFWSRSRKLKRFCRPHFQCQLLKEAPGLFRVDSKDDRLMCFCFHANTITPVFGWKIFCRAVVERLAVKRDPDSATKRKTCIVACPQAALPVLRTSSRPWVLEHLEPSENGFLIISPAGGPEKW